jgi:sterol desaturase/sphingolipid hydroxylase (fatty acid hydroxylase superfamily)
MANLTAVASEPSVLEVLALQQDYWATWHYVAFALVTSASMAFIQYYVMWDGSVEMFQKGKPFRFGNIPNGGPVLTDEMLTHKDYLWTGINNIILTPIYVLHTMTYVRKTAVLDWTPLPGWSYPLQLFLIFFIFDAMYVPLHGISHWPVFYPWVHKHHHRQHSPYRGMWDGSNVNPIEFIAGTYLHLISNMILERSVLHFGFMMHWSIPAVFFLTSGAWAALNHSRHDVRVLAPFLFDVRDHSVHHGWPTSNYGQFTMWWDRMWGSYLSYDEFMLRKAKGSLRRSESK